MVRVTVEDKDTRIVIDGDDVTKEEWNGGVSGLLLKADATQRYTLLMGYPANKADVGVALDGHKDFARPEAIEKCAWEFMANPNIGLWHEDGTDGSGKCVESYIYRGPDWTIKAANDSECVIKAGDWLLGIQWSEETWPLVLEGKIGGGSMQGTARRRTPESTEGLRD